jgi:hypothetical protein
MPVAFGADGKCYYVKSPAEAQALRKQGKCPAGSAPAPMPQTWLIRYYPFYSSDYNRNTYVPLSQRTVYADDLTSFGEDNAPAIDKAAPKAVYVDDQGNKVSGGRAGVSDDGRGISDDGGFSGGHGGDGGHGGGDGGGGR